MATSAWGLICRGQVSVDNPMGFSHKETDPSPFRSWQTEQKRLILLKCSDGLLWMYINTLKQILYYIHS